MIDDFQMTIGAYPDFIAKIYLSHDKNDFKNITNSFGGITEYSNAFYDSGSKKIFIKSYFDVDNRNEFYTILLHEYIHAFIDDSLDKVPLWFHEGMAVYFSQQYSTQMALNLGIDYLTNDVKRLDKMENNYPVNSLNLSSFYAKSAQAVRFLHKEYPNGLSKMFNKKGNFNIVFTSSFNMTKKMFYQKFEKKFTRGVYLNIIYAIVSVLWMVLPVIILIGWYRQSKKRQLVYDEMEDSNQIKIL